MPTRKQLLTDQLHATLAATLPTPSLSIGAIAAFPFHCCVRCRQSKQVPYCVIKRPGADICQMAFPSFFSSLAGKVHPRLLLQPAASSTQRPAGENLQGLCSGFRCASPPGLSILLLRIVQLQPPPHGPSPPLLRFTASLRPSRNPFQPVPAGRPHHTPQTSPLLLLLLLLLPLFASSTTPSGPW